MVFLPTNRRKFIQIVAAAGVGAIAVDSTLIEPNRPRVVRREIALKRWPAHLEGFTIALLSDFHYDPYFSGHPLHASIGLVNGLHPDLIVLTGDFVSAPLFSDSEKADQKAASAAEPCARLLRQMQAPHGLWAVLGNHDVATNPNEVTSALQNQGIGVLANQSAPIEANGARFWLAGVNDVLARASDLDAALRPVPGDEATILLAHEPDYADDVSHYPVDMQLSGHSHGGQVRLPLVGPLYLPRLARKYVWGLYRVGPLTLYTNPGLGTLGVPIRWNCPPEITLLTLRRASG
ncbi:Metallophosphoesterase [Candidatus Sulfotelmatobacter kueseliae]|uniref:Metallophosphoesterase n=1 Tax=Candidatus Sulfotelmatobacter kueseliae TaxID=2042962 RepID=A0A2U3KW20_9BACT|nr:Metallophosphoesterase [Candidatus Sulfotelmatobacter kueseliae]